MTEKPEADLEGLSVSACQAPLGSASIHQPNNPTNKFVETGS